MPRPLHSLATLLVLALPALGLQAPTGVVAHCIDVGQADSTLLEFPCGAVLIDAGSDTQERADALVAYLRAFFDRRTDLNNTLSAVYVTHAHIDHTRALREVAEAFTIQGYIDNGHREGMGGGDERWLVDQIAAGRATQHREVIETDGASSAGLTDGIIDPLSCASCDPRFTVLSGGYPDNTPGWPSGEFENQNNHSLFLRVDFGEASFLFLTCPPQTGPDSNLGSGPQRKGKGHELDRRAAAPATGGHGALGVQPGRGGGHGLRP